MDHYIDIHLQPDPEFPPHLLMAALYAKLHRALAQVQARTIGVSFPGYGEAPATLGNTMRLLASEADLRRLMEQRWLQGMGDHVDVRPVLPVPANATPRTLQRVQAKSSAQRLRRRQMRRHGLTESQARERVPEFSAETLRLPFVLLSSATTGQRFRLFLRLGPPAAGVRSGDFNTYGLSSNATVPWF